MKGEIRTSSDEKLIEGLRKISNLEVAAEKIYKEHIEEFEDEGIRNGLGKIREDEARHVILAERMLSFIEGDLKLHENEEIGRKDRFGYYCPSCGKWQMSQGTACRACSEKQEE